MTPAAGGGLYPERYFHNSYYSDPRRRDRAGGLFVFAAQLDTLRYLWVGLPTKVIMVFFIHPRREVRVVFLRPAAQLRLLRYLWARNKLFSTFLHGIVLVLLLERAAS